MTTAVIDRFDGEHRFLSNFYVGPHPVVYRGHWPTAEHAYQAAKSYDPHHVQRVRAALTPGEAKRAGRGAVLVPHWETTRVLVMWQVLVAKFGRDLDLWDRLVATGYARLVEGNHWHDQFWGDCHCDQRPGCAAPGENWLGRLLEVVRDANPSALEPGP